MKIKIITRLVYVSLFLTVFNLPSAKTQIPLDGLIGYYTFENSLADSSGFQNDGVAVGDDVTFVQGFDGSDDGALFLNGGYVDLGAPAQYQMTDSISVAVWINPTSLFDWHAILSKWNGFGEDGYYIGINPEGFQVRWNVDMPFPLDGGAVQENTWTHLVGTHDGNTSKIYINGELVVSESFPQIIMNNEANVFIGSQFNLPDIGTFFGGIDEVIIYRKALNESEVEAIYNYVPFTTSTSNITVQDISVFPNPTHSHIYLKTNLEYENISYSVFDVQGRNIQEGKANSGIIDISTHIPGIYFLRMVADDYIINKRIILN